MNNIFTLLLVCTLCFYANDNLRAQGAPKPDVVPVTSDQSTEDSSLNPNGQNLKVLFEKTYQASLTEAQFKNKLSTSLENLAQWEEVLAQLKNDPSADLSYLREFVDAMTVKAAYIAQVSDVSNTAAPANIVEQPTEKPLELDPVNQDAKTLFEEAHQVSLTTVQSEDQMNTSAAKPLVAQVQVELQEDKKTLTFQSALNISKEGLEAFQEKVNMVSMKGLQNFTINPETGQCVATVDANIEASDLRHFFATMGYNQFEFIE